MNYCMFSSPRKSSDETRVNEDAYGTSSRGSRGVFVVADGHGRPPEHGDSKHGAALLARNVANWLRTNLAESREVDVPSSFADTSSRIDRTPHATRCGAVCAVAVVQKRSIVVGWVGDVSVLLCSRGGTTAELLTLHHSLEQRGEAVRIAPLLRSGEFGIVESTNGRPRLWNPRIHVDMSPTRAFGDLYMRPAVIPTPDILELPRDSGILILHSDGAADAVAAAIAESRRGTTVAKLCQSAQRCYEQGRRRDDATAIFVEI